MPGKLPVESALDELDAHPVGNQVVPWEAVPLLANAQAQVELRDGPEIDGRALALVAMPCG